MEELTKKAEVLLEALQYIQKFQGAIFVIKYGGSFMDSPDPGVRTGVAKDIVFLEAVGINPVVVHGGGKAISRAMEQAGIKPAFVKGMRVTDKATMKIVDDVLSNKINPEIVYAIQQHGGKAKGFSGRDIFKCVRMYLTENGNEKVDIGYVGEVVEVNTKPIIECIENRITPVISPVATGVDDGLPYNCNADVAAAQVAIALKARRLVFMSDVAGLMRNPADSSTVIPHLKIEDVESLKAAGVIDRGMIPKIDSAVAAIKAGVEKVSLVDGRVPHSVLLEIFTDKGVGTEVVE
ncbi:MAG: acetylglutamate kinase [Verrucomicrobiia bacterium]|jgi:acetylglutamate kinase